MKRKIYETVREQKTDQLLGLIAFPLLNILLWGIGYIGSEYEIDGVFLVPWIVNGGFVTIAFIFRPHIGVGYLASFCIIMAGVIVLGVLFLAACFAAFTVSSILTPSLEKVGVLVFSLLFLGGLFFIGRWTVNAFNSWWSSSGGEPCRK
jgi:hypothetical protein